jgi:tetratricopeptide (TPR) repeat protein
MSRIAGKTRNHEQWLELLWHVHCGLLDLASLTGQRAIERRELGALELLAGRQGGQGRAMHILESKVRYLVDTGDIGEAEQQAEGLIAEAESSGQREHLRKAYSWRAVILRELSRYPTAIDDFQKAEGYSDNDLQLMELWLDKGMTLSYANRFEEAESMLKQALAVALKYNDVNSQGTAWNNLGICYGQQKLREQAAGAYHRAFECYQRTGYKLGSAMVSGNVAEIYISLGLLDRALMSARECIRLGTEAEDIISIGLGHDLQGRVLEELGESGPAIESMERSLGIYEEIGDDFAWVVCQLKLAPLMAEAGQIPKALKRLKALEEKAAGIGSDKLKRDVRSVKAAVLLGTGETERSLELARDIMASPGTGVQDASNDLMLISKIHLALGNKEEAVGSFRQAMKELPLQATKMRQVELHSYGWKLYLDQGSKLLAGECRSRGLRLLQELREGMADRAVWERYCRKKEVAFLLNETEGK